LLVSTLASRKHDNPSALRSETICRGSMHPFYAGVGRSQIYRGTELADALDLAQTHSMTTKTAREVLEWLLQGREDLLHVDGPHAGEPNFYKLERLIQKALGRTVSQSTFHRLWTGATKEMRGDSVEVLSKFFRVPESVIRGELTLPQLESLGMNITLADIQLLSQLRNLPPELRRAVETQIHAMQPTPLAGETPQSAEVAPRTGATGNAHKRRR
jgi:hypothetical protein